MLTLKKSSIFVSMRRVMIYQVSFILGMIIFTMSCSENLNPSSNNHTTKLDSTAVLLEQALIKLAGDSSLQNFNACIALTKNDSLKQVLEARRRKMFTSFSSFEKLKINAEAVVKINPCYGPLIMKIDRIHNEHYQWKDLFNEKFAVNDYRARRFVIGDFNTKDEEGHCKGCQEEFPDIWALPELRAFLKIAVEKKVNLYDDASIQSWFTGLSREEQKVWQGMTSLWKNLRDHVESYRTQPLKKDTVIDVKGKTYCIGQRLCLCEIVGDTIIKYAQFVTSSKNAAAPQSNQIDFDGQRRYYAPMNRLTTRYWDDRLKYDSLDRKRDEELCFSSSHVVTYKGTVPLPNFMHIIPDDAFPGAKGFVNGIHEFAVGGSAPGLFMGTPVSLGCVRLHDYPSKFIRWWTPVDAKMFIFYEDKRYQQKP